MKKIIAAIILTATFGCQDKPKGYAISGSIEGVEDGKMIYVSNLDENNRPVKVDSVVIKDGKFSKDLEDVSKPALSFLNIQDTPGNVIYISENEELDFTIYKDSVNSSSVKGGDENKIFYEYLNHLKSLNKKTNNSRKSLSLQMQSNGDSTTIAKFQKEEDLLRESDMKYKKKLVTENQDSFVSVLILTDMLNMQAPSGEVKELFAKLSPDVQQSVFGVKLKEELDNRSATEIGNKAPDFSGPNPAGEEVSLESAMGKVTLIDFWAGWCKPCRVENPNVVKIYNKYHDQGFNIIGVSLDREGQKDSWEQAIVEDNLTWTQISNLQFWQDPIAAKYGVRAIPAQFILDQNGVIVAKNLRGEELDAKVKELLENQ